MKKFVSAIACLLMLFSLTSCTSPASPTGINNAPIKTASVYNGSGDTVIGERAYIEIDKSVLQSTSQEDFVSFAKEKVQDSGYNWFTIICEDGTGIVFTGSMIELANYGALSDDGTIDNIAYNITISNDGTVSYTPVQ